MDVVNANLTAISAKSRHIVLVGYDGIELLDLTGPASVFARAERNSPGSYSITYASKHGGKIVAQGGLVISELKRLEDIGARIDTLIVAGAYAESWNTAVEQGLPDVISILASRSRRIASICTGAFLLAASGILDGRRATTHWGACDRLRSTFPNVSVERDAIFVDDAPVYTSAGVSAGIDLALHLVEDDLGHAAAVRVAREMVLYLRRSGGQSQYSELLCAQSEGAGAITSLVRWAVENLTEDLSVSKLAERACMSERTFAREFAKHYTEAPGAFFRNLRLERACVLLETTNWPIKTIAESSGFGSADALERAYRKRFDTPPSQTRKHFGRRF